jgi:hypothetical protein
MIVSSETWNRADWSKCNYVSEKPVSSFRKEVGKTEVI